MRRLPKIFYQGDTISDPANQEPLKIMNKHLSEIRAQIPNASAATRFDKMRDEIIKKFLIFYPFKLREMTDEFPFQLNMLNTKTIFNDLDTITAIAVKNVYEFVHEHKVIKKVGV